MSSSRSISILVCLILFAFTSASTSRAELLSGSAVTIEPSNSAGDLELGFHRADSFFLSEPDLLLIDRTIGSNTSVFRVSEGDILSAASLDSFPSVLDVVGESFDLPFGESYIGYAVMDPVDEAPFHTIGWAKLLRSNESLLVLKNAAEFTTDFGAASGIVVGVPEPSSRILLLVGLMVGCGCLPRRKRPSLISYKCS